MKIDIEQFLAITVALGAAGAIGVAAYSSRADLDKIAIEAPAHVDVPTDEPSAAEEVAAAVMPAVPAAPVDLDEAAGIPPVVPDDEGAEGYYAPGPDTETPNW